MSNTDATALANATRVHFIGVGGIGMSGLARLMLQEGKTVSGSDRAPSPLTEKLTSEGVRVFETQTPENITDDIEYVIYTEAMPDDHPEMQAARRLGVPMVNYFEALGLVANEYYLIAIAGTHGKTTTTAMLIDIFEAAGYDPTAIVGSLRSPDVNGAVGSNYRAGKSKYFIVEACEYKRDFLHLAPDVLVITNIEQEHVDYYKDLTDLQSAFRELAAKVPEDGAIVAQPKDPNVAPALEGVSASVLDYRDALDLNLPLTQPGMHNKLNAAAAMTAAEFVGITSEDARAALAAFTGTWRRFEYKGEIGGAPVYDDYAHHPTEVTAAIAGAREKYPEHSITVVFQPHTYTRTHAFFDEFVAALTNADRVYLVPIYAAREENVHNISSEQLAAAVADAGGAAEYAATLEEASEMIRSDMTENEVVLVLGAGTVTAVASSLTEA